MKELMIFLRPNRYFKTKEALNEARYYSMSTKDVLGRGKAGVAFAAIEGNKPQDIAYENSLVSKKMIEMVVMDEDVQKVIDIVTSVNSQNQEGDGKIFVLPVEDSIRIHTKEKGIDALI